MEVNLITSPQPGQTPDPNREAAEKLHAALFADMLRHGGLSEALSTGEDSLDSLASVVIDRVAGELASQDAAFTDHLYKVLKAY
ncbi:hypothetical protein [Parvularcula maris]|uniref:Uncharacterized protein n=1 Tax=Parvularcula maris TaxID=2965077 RepID=A0A9X2RHI2_9PROT|nr:hypothetical protein [Parvularcula maris]MCQ8184904.1 hypothetical protein [Parvularcula maris]